MTRPPRRRPSRLPSDLIFLVCCSGGSGCTSGDSTIPPITNVDYGCFVTTDEEGGGPTSVFAKFRAQVRDMSDDARLVLYVQGQHRSESMNEQYRDWTRNDRSKHVSLLWRSLDMGAPPPKGSVEDPDTTWLSCVEGKGHALDWPMKYQIESAEGEVVDCAVTEHSQALVEGGEDCRVVPFLGELEAEVSASTAGH